MARSWRHDPESNDKRKTNHHLPKREKQWDEVEGNSDDYQKNQDHRLNEHKQKRQR